MKKSLIFLILISFSLCHLSPEKIEEIKQRRKEQMKLVAECLLRNENISEELKTSIRENKEDDFVRALRPNGRRLTKNDLDIIRQCRKEAIRAKTEILDKDEHKKKDDTKLHDL